MRMTVFVAVFLSLAASAFAEPRLVVPPNGLDLGEIEAGRPVSGSLSMRNSGDAVLRVSRVKACCGAEASLEPMEIPPSGLSLLTVSLKPQLPGELSKSVRLYCDDPLAPVVAVPVTGSVRESAGTPGRPAYTLPAVIAAGFVDGFNPCSFAVMISLAGILAIGGRRRRARIVGGLAFCLGSFLTYVLMGLGLLQALRALDGLSTVRDAFRIVLALSLAVLSALSFRDAYRFRKVPVFSVVTLRLPEGVKVLIRKIALETWSGPSVFVAGLGCGLLVTVLDSLCTGQVYVPVLALIAREPGAWRSFALLIVYNLAFIAPLVAVFVCASKTTDAFQMAKWSSRNVFPAKVGLGIMFAVLAALVLLG